MLVGDTTLESTRRKKRRRKTDDKKFKQISVFLFVSCLSLSLTPSIYLSLSLLFFSLNQIGFDSPRVSAMRATQPVSSAVVANVSTDASSTTLEAVVALIAAVG